MISKDPDMTTFGLSVARDLSEASENAWPVIFDELRKRRQLSIAIHQMNKLLSDPGHRDLALAALRRIGLEHGG